MKSAAVASSRLTGWKPRYAVQQVSTLSPAAVRRRIISHTMGVEAVWYGCIHIQLTVGAVSAPCPREIPFAQTAPGLLAGTFVINPRC